MAGSATTASRPLIRTTASELAADRPTSSSRNASVNGTRVVAAVTEPGVGVHVRQPGHQAVRRVHHHRTVGQGQRRRIPD